MGKPSKGLLGKTKVCDTHRNVPIETINVCTSQYQTLALTITIPPICAPIAAARKPAGNQQTFSACSCSLHNVLGFGRGRLFDGQMFLWLARTSARVQLSLKLLLDVPLSSLPYKLGSALTRLGSSGGGRRNFVQGWHCGIMGRVSPPSPKALASGPGHPQLHPGTFALPSFFSLLALWDSDICR